MSVKDVKDTHVRVKVYHYPTTSFLSCQMSITKGEVDAQMDEVKQI